MFKHTRADSVVSRFRNAKKRIQGYISDPSIGIEKVFDVDEDLVAQTEWFDDEIIGTKHGDFFVKRSINYSKRSQSITSDDLF